MMLKHLMLYRKMLVYIFTMCRLELFASSASTLLVGLLGGKNGIRPVNNFLRVWSGSILVVMNGYRSLV